MSANPLPGRPELELSDAERALCVHLLSMLTPARRRRFAEVLDQRTRRITVVLEDVFHADNISAVLRSCDAFGVQDVHVIETYNDYEPNHKIALGSEQWLSVHRYTDCDDPRTACAQALRDAGYRIVATTPVPGADGPAAVELDRPVAVLFGGEKDGLSPELAAWADQAVSIPMYGFVESLNISVAAAILLHTLRDRLDRAETDCGLSEPERERLLFEWARTSTPHLEAIEARFWREHRRQN